MNDINTVLDELIERNKDLSTLFNKDSVPLEKRYKVGRPRHPDSKAIRLLKGRIYLKTFRTKAKKIKIKRKKWALAKKKSRDKGYIRIEKAKLKYKIDNISYWFKLKDKYGKNNVPPYEDWIATDFDTLKRNDPTNVIFALKDKALGRSDINNYIVKRRKMKNG